MPNRPSPATPSWASACRIGPPPRAKPKPPLSKPGRPGSISKLDEAYGRTRPQDTRLGTWQRRGRLGTGSSGSPRTAPDGETATQHGKKQRYGRSGRSTPNSDGKPRSLLLSPGSTRRSPFTKPALTGLP